MIGCIVYVLQAETTGTLPAFHGRLMHGLMFHLLQSYSPEVAAFIHDKLNYKPFTVSELWQNRRNAHKEHSADKFEINRGQNYFWRVTALQDNVLQILLSLSLGMTLKVGDMIFSLQNILANGHQHTGIVDENELVAQSLSVPAVHRLGFHFHSPVSFRYFDKDYPFPLPQLILGSLADKWTQMEMPAELDAKYIREIAADLVPQEWYGSCKKIYFGTDRGSLGFQGKFTYDIASLSKEQQQIFLLLTQFANFSGVGRLTAQGFGQTHTRWY